MLNKLILFCTFAIFMLAVGGAVTPLQAHCLDVDIFPDAVHSGEHPHCTNDDRGYYSVRSIGTDLSSPVTEPAYIGWDGVGKSESVDVSFQFLDLDLSFFENNVDYGAYCFGQAPVEEFDTVLSIFRDKDGKLAAWYWFRGHDIDGVTEVGYLLKLKGGVLEPDWLSTVDEYEAVFWEWEFGGHDKGSGKKFACKVSSTVPVDTQIRILRTP